MSRSVERTGQPRGSHRYVLSQRGNDLARRYRGRAALSAVRGNPAVRALDRRVVAKHAAGKARALGHALGQLLHRAFALCKSGQPFDPTHYPGEGPGQEAGGDIDRWAELHHLRLRAAALDLVGTFALEAAPRTEKRNG